MKEFEAHRAKARSRNMTIAAASVGVLALAGVGFAASGGIGALRTWFVNINVGGQTHRIAVDDGGNGTINIVRADGGNTTVDVNAETLPGGNKTKIVMRTASPGEESEEIVESRRQSMSINVDDTDAMPLDQVQKLPVFATWAEGDRRVSMHVDREEGAEMGTLHIVVAGFDGNPEERVLVHPTLPASLLNGKPEISVDDAGRIALSVRQSNGANDERVAKLIFAASHSAAGGMHDIPDLPGAVKVRVDDKTGEIDVDLPEGATVTGNGSPK
ncbi:MAG: hypothetical protein SF069_15420 [Phycisphaerae bacterium]|nr:hypothetical protein [Phycisphaerae bacterium]